MIVEEEETGNVVELRRRHVYTDDNDDEYDQDDSQESEYEDVDDEDVSSSEGTRPTSNLLARLSSSLSNIFSTSGLPRLGARFYTFVASSAWVLTTTLIMVGLPILYAYDREQNAVAMERDQQRFDTK